MQSRGKPFPTTRWTLIQNIKDVSDTADQSTQTLCKLYWEPIYSFIRFRGHTREESEDLTQAFFAQAIKSEVFHRADSSYGRLRTFLLKILGDFLTNHHHYRTAQKRGGDWLQIPFEEMENQLKQHLFLPEKAQEAFDYQWALGIVRLTAETLRQDYKDNGSLETFECLRGFIPGTINPPTFTEAARQLGISESGARTAIFRLRNRFRQTVRSEIQKTLQVSDDIDEELEYLIKLLAKRDQNSSK